MKTMTHRKDYLKPERKGTVTEISSYYIHKLKLLNSLDVSVNTSETSYNRGGDTAL